MKPPRTRPPPDRRPDRAPDRLPDRRPVPPGRRQLTPQEAARARQGRLVALVIAGTGALWLLAQALIPRLGITPRYAILIDLGALGAFIWSLVTTWRIWRATRPDE